MGKSDQKAVQSQANQQIKKTEAQGEQTNEQLQGMLTENRAQKNSLFPQATQGFTDIQSGGGYDPAILGKIRGTYNEFADTGGISAEGADAMRARASRAATSTYETGRDEAQRTASATGGYGDTSAAISGNLARKGSQAAERAVTDSNAQIEGIRQQGRLAGTSGLASVEQNMAGNKLQASSGLANMYGLTASETNATIDQILKNYQTTGTLTASQMAILQNMANQPGVFDKIMSTIGTLGGTAAGIMGALPSSGGKG